MLRLLRTARYLKPVQVTNRLSRRLTRPRVFAGDTPPFKYARSRWETVAPLPASIVDSETACFLNEPGPLLHWHNPDKSLLWLYNLHYFDDLVAEQSAQRATTHQELIGHWLQNNPPASGVGWQPYPLSLRIVNWVKWLLAGNEPVPGMPGSLFQQAHLLSQQLEYHLQGNHLLANAKALVFAGTFFQGVLAAKWLAVGLELLNAQLGEQVLEDGGHFERSPMYHNIILMDVLDLIQLGQLYPENGVGRIKPTLQALAASMLGWMHGLVHPDGEIPFFNDAAFGITPEPDAILAYARAMGVALPVAGGVVRHFEESGYISVRGHDQVALLDVAPVGPDYIPGHAHADTLSFEWSLFGQRVLVNSGTSEYGVSAERLRQRGTAAHNTVLVNGQDSSEVWSGFRVARRARPMGVQLSACDDSITAQASHSGYHRLRPKVTHTREWHVSAGSLQVTDTLEGKFRQAQAYFYFHPSIRVAEDNGLVSCILPDGRCCEVTIVGGSAVVEGSTWHSGFGLSEANKRLSIHFEGPRLKTVFRY